MKVKEETEKVGLKLNRKQKVLQKTKIMASGPITSWQIDGETVSDFILGGSKITADGDCNCEIKRRLLLGRESMTNLVQFSSFQFSCSVMSNTLQPHGLKHARRPCPSPTSGACSNSCPLSQWKWSENHNVLFSPNNHFSLTSQPNLPVFLLL